MSISTTLDRIHFQVKQNKWFRYFAIFCRIMLALGFLPSGFVKIMGERFTDLSNNHPLGHYLEALYYTGYYYTFIGIMQVTAAILLLLPWTATLGAVLYFPIILNICILSLAVRFDGSWLSAPLMVLANLYLLCWYYDKIKYIFPFNRPPVPPSIVSQQKLQNQFPTAFFTGVFATIFLVVWLLIQAQQMMIMPRNTLPFCVTQCEDSENFQACNDFCECIHLQGQTLNKCLAAYNKAIKQKRIEEGKEN